MKNKNEIKLYQQLIDCLSRGFNMLGDDAKAEIKNFVINKQHPSGLFLDRANNSDVYYSFFGAMLSLTINNTKGLNQLKSYLLSASNMPKPTIDALVYILLKIILEMPTKISTIKIVKQVFYSDKTINLYYRIFIAALILEAKGKANILLKLFFRLLLRLKKTKDLPCSILAAVIISKHYMNLSIDKEQKSLMLLYQQNGGFRAFKQAPQTDMLSTAVSLFALNNIGFDFSLIKPDCLGFIEDNYSQGAFLSADGDKTLDLEYTFYGLLALGSLK